MNLTAAFSIQVLSSVLVVIDLAVFIIALVNFSSTPTDCASSQLPLRSICVLFPLFPFDNNGATFHSPELKHTRKAIDDFKVAATRVSCN